MFRRKDEALESEQLELNEDTPIMTGSNETEATPETAETPEAEATTAIATRTAGAAAFRPQPAPANTNMVARPAAPLSAERSERSPSPASKANSKRILTVGNDIHMKGEINTCDRLVIEGIVDATLKEVHTVELAETGSLRGTAEVEDAEISGYFEGDLTVAGRLIIYSTGTVRGNISYGEIEIERGGQISGSISQASEAAQAKKKQAA